MNKKLFNKKIIIILISLVVLLIFCCVMFLRTAYDISEVDLLIHNRIQLLELKGHNNPNDKVYEVNKLLGERKGYFIHTKYIYANTKTYEANSNSYSDHLFPLKITILKLVNKVNIISSYVPDDGEAFPKGFERHFPKEITNQYYNNLGDISNELAEKMKKLEIQ